MVYDVRSNFVNLLVLWFKKKVKFQLALLQKEIVVPTSFI